ncbi:dUTP diphosphatase [Enterococcus italicus]|uniref:dUTP diphosphatase n=1 Tax=Enterococcus italicus TaxID=246144 RepID=UPI00207485AF|nr:dUTP diphosphatase [Enterococcus italicus]MCM6931246.1 dUTP diphosphatase [Enterococcus italicus]
MKLKIKQLSQSAKYPYKAHETDAGFDIFTAEEVTLIKGKTYTISTGIAMAIPDGYYGELKARSSIDAKTPLRIATGTIDSSYRGEVKIITELKYGDTYTVEKGAKIAQLILHKVPVVEIEVMDELDETDRGTGGFGSTGK